MPFDQNSLSVRRHDRQDCNLPARCHVADSHADQVVFSSAVAEPDGSLELRVVDCSEGGLGLRSPVFVPKGARIVVELSLSDGQRDARHEFHLRVQRAAMVDRAPAYYLGASLVGSSAAPDAVRELLDAVRSRPSGGTEAAA